MASHRVWPMKLTVLIACFWLACSSRVLAAAVPAGYHAVAQAEGVPADLLYALACAESGRPLPDGAVRPWPWALNVGGESRYFDSRLAAYRDLVLVLKTTRNVDIGLGQINWHWHRERLRDAWQALDPYFNLGVAARFLREQFEHCDCDDWWIAIERYHAPSNSERAGPRRAAYRRRVEQCWRQQSAT